MGSTVYRYVGNSAEVEAADRLCRRRRYFSTRVARVDDQICGLATGDICIREGFPRSPAHLPHRGVPTAVRAPGQAKHGAVARSAQVLVRKRLHALGILPEPGVTVCVDGLARRRSNSPTGRRQHDGAFAEPACRDDARQSLRTSSPLCHCFPPLAGRPIPVTQNCAAVQSGFSA